MFKGAIAGNAKLLLFTRNDKYEIEINDARKKGWGLFPGWSPSWGEVNYLAFNLPTAEFHDELYGFLHEKFMSDATDQTDADNRSKQTDFEKNFLQKRLPIKRSWTPEFGGQARNEEKVTLPTFIRNKAHHPENKTMQSASFSEDELRESINQLIDTLKN